jgi:hypothetical protein
MQQKPPPPKKARMCLITDTLYNESGTVPFYADAPEYPPLAPVKGRATPYTAPPRVCTVNYHTGTVKCWDNESRGGLYGTGAGAYPFIPRTFNHVQAGMTVNEPADSPLNRILQRPPTGPWQLVGAAVAQGGHAPAEEKTMMVYAQTVDASRDRYNYRVVDSNSVPLDVAHKVHWKQEGDALHVPGYGANYQLHLYERFRP